MLREDKVTIIIEDFSNNQIRIDQSVLKYKSYREMIKAIDIFIKVLNVSDQRFVNVSYYLNLLEDMELYINVNSIKSIKLLNTKDIKEDKIVDNYMKTKIPKRKLDKE